MSATDLLISGQGGGKQINIVPAVKPIYERLNTAAKSGNHWARLTVTGLRALASGRLDKNNIFVRPGGNVRYGKEQFFVILPGCKATVERLPNDSYQIVNLTLDTGYFELNTQKMAGLYRAKKKGVDWKAEHVENGQITPDGGATLVGISDSNCGDDAGKAAGKIAGFVSVAPGFSGPHFDGFNMHFTPGVKTLGGLKNYRKASNPLSNEGIQGSAQLLARTMYKAKNLKKITWASEFGGSAVLTQAMKILADQGVTLGESHSAFLYRPNTNVEEAVTWAHKLGMTLDRNFTKTLPMDFMGNRNQIGLIKRRFKAEKGYKAGHVVWDLGYQVANVGGSVGMAAGALSTGGVAMAVPAWPILATMATAFATTIGSLALADSAWEHLASDSYAKYIGVYNK
jgi:hypothetical protein